MTVNEMREQIKSSPEKFIRLSGITGGEKLLGFGIDDNKLAGRGEFGSNANYDALNNEINLETLRSEKDKEITAENLVHEISHALDFNNKKDLRPRTMKRLFDLAEHLTVGDNYLARPSEIKARARALAYRLNRYYNERPKEQRDIPKSEYIRRILNNYFNRSLEETTSERTQLVEALDNQGKKHLHIRRMYQDNFPEKGKEWTKEFIKYLNRFIFDTKTPEEIGISDFPSDFRIKCIHPNDTELEINQYLRVGCF